MKKRWISLLVENEIGVLAWISGLFSAKSYNLNSLTVGVTEDPTVSRMTISLFSDDKTFEQVKKQFSRSIEVIKVTDYTGTAIHSKELMYISVSDCSEQDMTELYRIADVSGIKLIDYTPGAALAESLQTEERNDQLAATLKRLFPNRIQITRGGSVAVESI